ncbi:FAR1-related protein [Trifolium medium]|uniref:FAR1-related protein n=1 Tax=Trifolium medium TaxID=97028 RepID=A0A392QFM0_9FABA|nr:FAR1-related protein [Trifolium medium]
MERNVSWKAVKRLVAEVARVEHVGTDKSKCGCLNRTTFGLPYACELTKTINEGKPICLDDIHTQWKRLSLNDADN